MGLEEQLANAIITAFDELGGNPLDAIEAAMQCRTVEDWVNQEAAKSVVAGGAEMLIPGLHALTIPAGIAYLLRQMSHISWGIGALNNAYVMETAHYSDLRNILAIWANDSQFNASHLDHLAIDMQAFAYAVTSDGQQWINSAIQSDAQSDSRSSRLDTLYALGTLADDFLSNEKAHELVLTIAGPSATQSMAKSARGRKPELTPRPEVIHHPLGRTISTRLATKLAARLASRLPARFLVGFIPLAGAVFNGLFNAYTLRSMAEAAEIYYDNRMTLTTMQK